MIRKMASAFVAGVVGSACTSGPSILFPTAVASVSCGPTDGPAVLIELSTAGRSDPVRPPLVRIMVYRSPAEAMGRTWAVGSGSDEGFGSYCATETNCEAATEGSTIRIARSETAGTLSGDIDLAFPKRGAVRGTFQAVWRERAVLCG